VKKTALRPVAILLSLVMVSSVLISACSGTTAGAVGTGVVTIKYWDWWVTQGPTIDKEIKLFEAAHPNIKIEKTTQVVDKYPDLLQLAIKSGNAPDVFLAPQTPAFNQQVKLGWFLPLNKWATKEWQAKFPPGSFAEGDNVRDGKIYMAPFEGPAPWLQLYVNTKLFKEAGLVDANGQVKLPQTWDDVRTDAQIITKAGNGKYYGYGFGDKQKFNLPRQLMMAQTSGAAAADTGFDSRVGRYVWGTNPVFADFIKFFMGMKSDGSIIPNAMSIDDEMARAQFAEGKFAMMVGGVWNMSGWATTHPDFKDYAVVALPHEGEAPASYFYRSPGASGNGFVISAQTKHPEEAWLWYSWLNSPEAAVRWVKDGQGLRVFPEANKPEYAPTPQFAQFMQIAKDGVKLGPSPSLQHPEMAEVKQQQTLPDIQAILEGIYTGQIQDYKTALKDLEQRQNAELDRAIKEAQARGVKVDPKWWVVPDWDLTKDYTGN
jgi:ABC-type glycerol-3-phosphate transport system substrate-binding protein